MGKQVETETDFIFLGSKNHRKWWLQPQNWKTLAPWKKSYVKLRQCFKKHRLYFPDKGPYSQSYGFSGSHIQIWELDHKEGWVPNNWCFRTVVLEKTLESLLDCKEIQPVHSEGNQSWIFIEGLMLKPKLQYFGHLMWRTDSLEKTLTLVKIEGKRRMGL